MRIGDAYGQAARISFMQADVHFYDPLPWLCDVRSCAVGG